MYIQIEESYSELIQQRNKIEINPERLSQVESRLDSIYTVSRKHNVPVNTLHQTHKDLSKKMKNFRGGDDLLSNLKSELIEIHNAYIVSAGKLTKKRDTAIKEFKKSVNSKLQDLKMNQCIFDMLVKKNETNSPSINGQENIEFLISTIQKSPLNLSLKLHQVGNYQESV